MVYLVVFNEFMNVFLLSQGGRDMLKDVWKNVDMMDPENFDPKIFFKLHGNTQIFSIIDTIDLVCSQWYSASGNWMCQEHRFRYLRYQLNLKRLNCSQPDITLWANFCWPGVTMS